MKSLITSITAVALLSLSSYADDITVATVDMTKLYNGYFKTKVANEKIQSSLETAKEQREELLKQGQALVDEYKEITERANNPALTEEARGEAQLEAERKLQEIQEKEREVQQFQINTQNSIQQRQRTHRDLMLDEIKKVVVKMARDRGANLVFDSSGLTALGLPGILYANTGWDFTEDALVRINADAPAK